MKMGTWGIRSKNIVMRELPRVEEWSSAGWRSEDTDWKIGKNKGAREYDGEGDLAGDQGLSIYVGVKAGTRKWLLGIGGDRGSRDIKMEELGTWKQGL